MHKYLLTAAKQTAVPLTLTVMLLLFIVPRTRPAADTRTYCHLIVVCLQDLVA